jgi:hypothetical protein
MLLLRTDDAAIHELRFTVDDNKERIVLKSVKVCSLASGFGFFNYHDQYRG